MRKVIVYECNNSQAGWQTSLILEAQHGSGTRSERPNPCVWAGSGRAPEEGLLLGPVARPGNGRSLERCVVCRRGRPAARQRPQSLGNRPPHDGLATGSRPAARWRGAPASEDGDWPAPPMPNQDAWDRARAELGTSLEQLATAVSALSDEHLREPVGTARDRALGAGVTRAEMVAGVLQHNAYHSGQIALLLKA
ncbi:MAG TPA: DinB family protein [Thermoanaerobaculia bacterium]|nr:DinB family protein [Thermoanaerobaculia bacterium]